LAGNCGGWQALTGRAPTYYEFFGLWLNRRRTFYRAAGTVAYGAAIALGAFDPGNEYYESMTDGHGEALLLKARHDASKR